MAFAQSSLSPSRTGPDIQKTGQVGEGVPSSLLCESWCPLGLGVGSCCLARLMDSWLLLPASWKTGPWAPCSASCGGGSQVRSVYCVWSDGAGVQEAVKDADCAGLPGKPPTAQACNLQRCAAWSAEPWGECSVSCGAGVRRRSVTCRSAEGSLLPATACPLQDQPPLTEPCVHDDCSLLSDQAWHIGTWGLVSACLPHTCRPALAAWASGRLHTCPSLDLTCITRHLPPVYLPLSHPPLSHPPL